MVRMGFDMRTSHAAPHPSHAAPQELRSARAPSRRHRTDAIEYRIIFSICFAALLGVGIAERLLPRDWRFLSAGPHGASLVGEVAAAAHRTTAIAFQG